MRFVDLDGRDGGSTGIVDPRPCLANLPELAERLPPGARAFATDPGHYAFSGRRCVKDLKPQRVRCLSDGEIEIRFGHNCWKHDEDLVVRYEGVSRFQADVLGGCDVAALGEVVLDEVLPQDGAAPMRWRAGRGRWSSGAGTSWLSGWRRTARMRVGADTGVGGPARPWPTLVG
ncbi:hypothetical protein [Streptomyces sp. NPDC051001]|uniref:hypothetical protein n=1 Tax=Streptomyces sp. NPDC051001 TaxID=3155795 RepID=UPI00343D35FF